jgi:hypothetical protein
MTPAWPRALYIYRQCMFITVIITVWVPVQCNWRVYVKFVGTLPFPIIDCQNRKGILMLHCGLGMRNMNTFYTFRCPQSLEMIRLYLYKKCKLERDMTLCGDKWLYEEASLKKSRSSLLNSVRKQWCQCLCNIKIKVKCKIGYFRSTDMF